MEKYPLETEMVYLYRKKYKEHIELLSTLLRQQLRTSDLEGLEPFRPGQLAPVTALHIIHGHYHAV